MKCGGCGKGMRECEACMYDGPSEEMEQVLDALAACAGVIGTIEDYDHWKAQAQARKVLLAHGRPDPTPYLPKP